jgi:formylmethanofuran dehydrogenase subunit E
MKYSRCEECKKCTLPDNLRYEYGHTMCPACMKEKGIYDSAPDTNAHRVRVGEFLYYVAGALTARATLHDATKLMEPEKPIFDEFTPKLKGATYDSDEYKGFLKEMKVALDHHYENSPHHPEHFNRLMWWCEKCGSEWSDADLPGPEEDKTLCTVCAGSGESSELASYYSTQDMTMIDLIEMLADWKAASERHDDGDIQESMKKNKKRFNIPPALMQILQNTLTAMLKMDEERDELKGEQNG